MKTWTILMNLDEEILQMMKDARWIYDQALYHQRQKFFETRKEGKLRPSVSKNCIILSVRLTNTRVCV